MPAFAALLVGVVAAIGVFTSGWLPWGFWNEPATAPHTQTAAATEATDMPIAAGNPFTDEEAADAIAHAPGRVLGETASPAVVPTAYPIMVTAPHVAATAGVSPSFLAQFSQFLQSFSAYLASPAVASGTTYPRYGGYVPSTGGTIIGTIPANTVLASPAITGGTITDASSGSFDALSAGTLTLTSALTGTDATFSGTLTAGTLNVASVSSAGALIGPYFTATSTTATSTFAGAFTAANSAFNILQNGNVGVGTAAPSSLLHLYGGASGGTTGSGSFTIEDDASVFLQLMTPASNQEQIRFGDADNSGSGLILYHHGDDRMAFYTSATERLRITSAGNVGISTTTPWGKLSVTGSGTGTGLAFAVADSTNTPRFVIQDNGKIGIGTTSPRADLHISGDGQLMIQNGNTLQDRDGDFWMTSNAYFDGTDWQRQNVSKTAFGLDLRGNSNIPNESEQGATLWVAQAGANPVSSTFGATGGWELGWTLTAARNFVIGGMGFELDGNGLTPYGRLVHNNSLSTVNTGIAKNIFADFSGRDASAQPSWFAGFVDDAFRVRRLAGSAAISNDNFSSLLSIDSSGNVGIGTTTPWGTLSVTNTGSSPSFVVEDSASPDSTPFVIDSTGAVGIGRVPPSGYKLIVQSAGNTSATYGFFVQNSDQTSMMAITDNGNVGIGTTTPWARLSVKGTGTGTGLAFAATDSANTPRFVIQDNGNVGIGTTTPTNKLEVAGNTFFGGTITGTSTLALTGTTGTTTIAAGQGLTIGDSQFVVQQGSGNVGIGTASPTRRLHVRSDGSYQFRLENGSAGGGYWNIAQADNSFGTGGGKLLFLPDSDVSTNATVAFTNSGNVGIGTTTPVAALTVAGSGSSRVNIGGFFGSGYGAISLNGTTDTTNYNLLSGNNVTDNSLYINRASGGAMHFREANGTDQLTILTGGNVGIGTTTPWGKLSITGSGTGTGLAFAVADSANTPRFVIQDNGNVGIGTTSPVGKLSVSGGSVYVDNTGAGSSFIGHRTDGTIFSIQAGTTNSRLLFDSGKDFTISDNTFDNIYNSTNGGAGRDFLVAESATGNVLLVTETSGNVGIGTTTPGSLLSLNDIANFTAATSTFYSTGGINLAAGCFAKSGSCLQFSDIVGTLGIAQGGTNATSQTTDGIAYYDGTTLTTGSLFTYDGTTTVLTANSANTSGDVVAMGIGGTQSTGNTGSYFGLNINPVYSAASGNTLANLAGMQSNPRNTGSGTVTNLFGVVAVPRNTSTGTTTTMYGLVSQPRASSGGVTNMYGAYLDCGASGASAVVSTCYGLRIGDFARTGTVTTSYGLYQDDTTATNYFGGNVGIGTTSPTLGLSYNSASRVLGIVGDGSASASAAGVLTLGNNRATPTTGDSVGTVDFVSVGNGTGSGQIGGRIRGLLNGSGGANGIGQDLAFSTKADNGAGIAERLRITGGGDVGIGTSSPTAQLHTTGTVRFSNFGAGSLQTDANGNVSVSSDERLKNVDGDFNRGLADIVKITPINYHWNELSGLDRTTQYTGFSAQNVRDAIPEAVGESPNGYLSLNDRPIIATLVNAVKEIWETMQRRFASQDARIVALEARIAELEARPVVNPDGSYTITVSSQTATPQGAVDSGQMTNDGADTALATSTPPAATATSTATSTQDQSVAPPETQTTEQPSADSSMQTPPSENNPFNEQPAPAASDDASPPPQ